jgi:hypothetical protein
MYPAVYPLAIDIAENLPNFEHLLPLRIMAERGTPSGGTKDGVNPPELFVQDLEPVPGEFAIQAAIGRSNNPRRWGGHRGVLISTASLSVLSLANSHFKPLPVAQIIRDNVSSICSY